MKERNIIEKIKKIVKKIDRFYYFFKIGFIISFLHIILLLLISCLRFQITQCNFSISLLRPYF